MFPSPPGPLPWLEYGLSPDQVKLRTDAREFAKAHILDKAVK